VVELPRLQTQQPHQMQAVCVIGVRRERLPAAKLRIEVPARLHVLQARLIERGWSNNSVG